MIGTPQPHPGSARVTQRIVLRLGSDLDRKLIGGVILQRLELNIGGSGADIS